LYTQRDFIHNILDRAAHEIDAWADQAIELAKAFNNPNLAGLDTHYAWAIAHVLEIACSTRMRISARYEQQIEEV
jgi:hypothetical protein